MSHENISKCHFFPLFCYQWCKQVVYQELFSGAFFYNRTINRKQQCCLCEIVWKQLQFHTDLITENRTRASVLTANTSCCSQCLTACQASYKKATLHLIIFNRTPAHGAQCVQNNRNMQTGSANCWCVEHSAIMNIQYTIQVIFPRVAVHSVYFCCCVSFLSPQQ